MNGAGYPFGTDESIVFGAVAYTSQVRHNNAAVQTVERVSELLGFDIIAAFVVSPFPQDMMVNRRQFRRQTEQLCIGKTATTNGDGYLPTLFGVFFFFFPMKYILLVEHIVKIANAGLKLGVDIDDDRLVQRFWSDQMERGRQVENVVAVVRSSGRLEESF